MKLRKLAAVLLSIMLIAASAPAMAAYDMPYYINVDLTNQIVTIFDTATDAVVRQMLCSSGAKDATPTGTFIMPPAKRKAERKEWFHFNAFGGYARYASRIFKDVMFHSLLYNSPNMASLSKQSVMDYGKAVSHGCIRMRWQDAEFIAKNCLPGTKVKIYKSREPDEDLRALLLQASYTNENGQTYNAYLGIPDEEGVMGRYSEGEDVRDLQLRLRDLGLYNDAITGVYQVPTVTAVREAQALMGVEQTGVATVAFQEAVYAADAPAAMEVLLKEGMGGPAVRSLQENLAALKLYAGDIDSVYDVDVVEAVKVFQGTYGYTSDGIATTEVQKAIHYEAGRLKKLFGDTDYTIQQVDEEIPVGVVNCELGVRLREEASVKSRRMGLLHKGDVVVVLDKGDEWSRVQKGKNAGYVKNMYVDFSAQTISSLKYVSESGDTEYSIGFTASDYYSGADRPADRFSQYLASGGSLDSYDDLEAHATVATGDPAVGLNLRREPGTDSEVLTMLPDGTVVTVRERGDEWSLVAQGDTQGYLLNQYLRFEGDAPDEEGLFIEEDDAPEHAAVACDTAEKAVVYDEDSADATPLGSLKNGTQVEVLQTIEGWSLISYQGHQGYMREADLRFGVDDIPA